MVSQDHCYLILFFRCFYYSRETPRTKTTKSYCNLDNILTHSVNPVNIPDPIKDSSAVCEKFKGNNNSWTNTLGLKSIHHDKKGYPVIPLCNSLSE